jgi:short-subunit dehydrogenase
VTSPVTVITGASGGIGETLAHVAARAGRKLVLVARSAEGLRKVADAIVNAGHGRPETIALDLGQAGAADRLAAELQAGGFSVSELVNNAGYGLVGATAELDRAAQFGIVDLNVRALTDLTLCFLPEIVAARGGILNVSSTAAFQPGPYMNVYYASKAYVLFFSEALHAELKGRVRVTALCPGPTPTGFHQRANPGRTSGLLLLLPQTSVAAVADAGWRGFERGKRVVIPGLLNKLGAVAARFSPHAILLPMVAALSASRRKSP